MKQYIGDSVYVDFDGHDIVLTTPNNRIVLESKVYESLLKWVEHLKIELTPNEEELRP